VIPFAFLALAAQVAAAQPPANNTTDVDQNTTPAEASPLAPTKLPAPPETPAPGARTLDDILKSVPPYEPPAVAPVPEELPRPGLVLAVPTAPEGVRPTYLNDLGSKPDGPATDADTLYENRVLGAFRAAEGNQGPLDGRWLVARAGGGVLYTLQFSDSRDRIEGAWRDMGATGKNATGFIDSVERGDTDTVVRFENGTKPAELRVHSMPDGGWVGQATTPSGKINVVMTRDQSVELAASKAPLYLPPPEPIARPSKHSKAKGKASSRGKASKSKSSSRSKGSSAKKKKKK
jgi:hypothetical protein